VPPGGTGNQPSDLDSSLRLSRHYFIRSTRSGSRRTLCGLRRCTNGLWTAVSSATSRTNASETLLQIPRMLPLGLGSGRIADRGPFPRRLDQSLSFGQKGGSGHAGGFPRLACRAARGADTPPGPSGPGPGRRRDRNSTLRRQTQAARAEIFRTSRNEGARSPESRSELSHPVAWRLERIVNGWGTQLPRLGKKTVPIPRRFVAVLSDERHDPTVSLNWQHYAGDAALGWRVKCHYSRPVSRRIVRNGEHCRGISDVHPDDAFFAQWLASGLNKTKGEVAAPRSFDDEIRRQSLAFSFAVLETDCGTVMPPGPATTF